MTGCARCGDCCESIWLPLGAVQAIEGMLATSDPPVGGNTAFMAEHWVEQERSATSVRYACDAFDPVHRLCTAHDDRPPVCRDFPWYSGPVGELRGGTISPRCSYWADVAPECRPDGVRPLLPLVMR